MTINNQYNNIFGGNNTITGGSNNHAHQRIEALDESQLLLHLPRIVQLVSNSASSLDPGIRDACEVLRQAVKQNDATMQPRLRQSLKALLNFGGAALANALGNGIYDQLKDFAS